MNQHYIDTDDPDVFGFLPDGRRVFTLEGRRLVMTQEAHAAAVRSALSAAQAEKLQEPTHPQKTKSVVGTESLSTMTCPKCGDALQHTAVCPKCAAGKIGYRHRYTCVCGGVDLISKDAL